MNSSGAAPVPPSLPSTTIKSGVIPVLSIALTTARNSQGWPMQSLKPVGLPPESERRLAMNCISSMGVAKAECLAGEMQSWPISTPRISEISLRHFRRRQHAAMPGLGALRELQLHHLDLRVGGDAGEFLRAETAVLVAAAEIA